MLTIFVVDIKNLSSSLRGIDTILTKIDFKVGYNGII